MTNLDIDNLVIRLTDEIVTAFAAINEEFDPRRVAGMFTHEKLAIVAHELFALREQGILITKRTQAEILAGIQRANARVMR